MPIKHYHLVNDVPPETLYRMFNIIKNYMDTNNINGYYYLITAIGNLHFHIKVNIRDTNKSNDTSYISFKLLDCYIDHDFSSEYGLRQLVVVISVESPILFNLLRYYKDILYK